MRARQKSNEEDVDSRQGKEIIEEIQRDAFDLRYTITVEESPHGVNPEMLRALQCSTIEYQRRLKPAADSSTKDDVKQYWEQEDYRVAMRSGRVFPLQGLKNLDQLSGRRYEVKTEVDDIINGSRTETEHRLDLITKASLFQILEDLNRVSQHLGYGVPMEHELPHDKI